MLKRQSPNIDLLELLRCSSCGSSDIQCDGDIKCKNCGVTFPVIKGIPNMTVTKSW